ncbi:MAG: molybdopterin-guanine dinucleotide biosynthesis protein B [Paracoccaceae bacterium]
MPEGPRVFGVTGWKDSGKTGLVERLVAHFTGAGLRVSTVKHAHASFDLDQPGRDSHRHRAAGAGQVLISSPARWALMTEARGGAEATLPELLARLDPCDLVLVEGFKTAPHPKVECWRAAMGHPLIAPGDPTIRAVAADAPPDALPRPVPCPVLPLDDTAAIAALIGRIA